VAAQHACIPPSLLLVSRRRVLASRHGLFADPHGPQAPGGGQDEKHDQVDDEQLEEAEVGAALRLA